MNLIAPPPLVFGEQPAFSSVLISEVDRALHLAWEALLAKDRGEFPEGTPFQMRVIVDRFIAIRTELLTGQVPEARYRIGASCCHIFLDSWNPEDPFGSYFDSVMLAYQAKLEWDGIPTNYANAESDKIVALRASMATEEASRPEPLPPVDHEARYMPHHPDPGSMRNFLAAAESIIARELPISATASGARRFAAGQQLIVRGLVGYWLQRPGRTVMHDLRQGALVQWDGLTRGYPGHIWDLQQLFFDAVAFRCEDVAAGIIRRAEDSWNLSQTRPVPWLTARLRCLFALHTQRKDAVKALFEDFRLAAFVDLLPPELEKDVPLIHNSYHLLVALRDRQWPELERRLGERMELLVKHFWRNIAPVALADTFGLSVARWARERGYQVQLQHVYLPLDWLDVPPESAPA